MLICPHSCLAVSKFDKCLRHQVSRWRGKRCRHVPSIRAGQCSRSTSHEKRESLTALGHGDVVTPNSADLRPVSTEVTSKTTPVVSNRQLVQRRRPKHIGRPCRSPVGKCGALENAINLVEKDWDYLLRNPGRPT